MDFLLNAAIQIAKKSHGAQVRKYTNEPYISHPFAVAGLVAAVRDDEDMVIASILHDVVEDTDFELKAVYGIFGGRIGEMVEDLTDISMPEDGNRKVRKGIDRDHTAQGSKEAKTIKLADLIDNTKTIVAFDPKFAKVYMAEKTKLLDVLGDGDSTLFKIAKDLVTDYYEST